MLSVSKEEILQRLRMDSPWWKDSNDVRWKDKPKRGYLSPFYELIAKTEINRAVVLMGPRRVGKTVMVHQAIAQLIKEGIDPKNVLYVPLDNPLYAGLSLENILLTFIELNTIPHNGSAYLFFDEIQYLKDWEKHLKSLVDSYPQHRFIATGSAAAALKLKSDESGAGRFTDFTLRPLTFYEYMKFRELSITVKTEIEEVNKEFMNYINFGGYPEAVFSEEIRKDPSRFIRNDIIDKVLLRDLPSLYGISDIPELNRLFMTLAHNTGQEIDLPGLSQGSNIAKGTLYRYLEYLEAAFLIKRVNRIDKSARRFKREHKFKVYLTNPSMYAALFGPVSEDNKTVLGKLAETAVFSHLFHLTKQFERLCYARWRNGEVDLVIMDETGTQAKLAIEIKWSDRPFENLSEIKGLLDFATEQKLGNAPYSQGCVCFTLTKRSYRRYDSGTVLFSPISIACYDAGRSLTGKKFREALLQPASDLTNQM